MNVLFVGPRSRTSGETRTPRLDMARRIEELSARLDELEQAVIARKTVKKPAKKAASPKQTT
ncbi:hypothetical protein JCM15519_14670 [Fundidesulfovibrio butyratiphilus]